jgi:hypothetical protein
VYTDGRDLLNPAWDFHSIPCDNFALVGSDGPKFDYFCLGHHKTYHGDPEREHKFWKYDKKEKLHNYLKWDFVDDISNVCSNSRHLGDKDYSCNGHGKGDYLAPTFHGDPSRDHKFWVYPMELEIQNP